MASAALLGLAMVSCGDDKGPVINPTEESFADIIFTYNVELAADASNYTGTDLDLTSVKGQDADGKEYQLWECFDLNSAEELIVALGTLSDGSQTDNTVSFIGFDVSTEYVVETPSSTNAYGHWHLANGDCGSWGDDAYLFAEGAFEEDLVMTIGQFPGRLAEGETYTIMEGMQNDDVVVALVINVTVKAQTAWTSYMITNVEGDEIEFEFDAEAIATYLGVDDLAKAVCNGTVTLAALNADGSENTLGWTQYDGDEAKGVFYNLEGNVCSWYNEAEDYYGHFYTTVYYGEYEGANYLGFCLTPYAATNDDCGYYEFTWALTCGDKTATVTYCTTLEESLDVTIIDGVTIDLSMPYNGDYAYYTIESELDYAALATIIGVDNLLAESTMFSVNADGSIAAKGTDNWFDVSGDLGTWGENASFDIKYESDTDADHLLIFIMPVDDTATRVGNTYTGAVAFANESGEAVSVRINLTITEAAE